MEQQQEMELQVRGLLEKSTGIECQSCGGFCFRPVTILRRVSKLYIGSPQDQVIPVQAFRCDDCGDVLREFFPDGMTDIEERLGLKKEQEVKITL
jgi:hypothetical protein